MEDTNHSLGSVIKEIRLEKQLTQSSVADDFFSTRHLINIENGSASPSTEILLHICKALGISIEELFNRIYAKELAALEEIKSTFNLLYEKGAFDQIHSELASKLAQIVNQNIRATVTYKFLKIMTDYYGQNDEQQTLACLEKLIETNPTILADPFNDLHMNILIQYIQVSSYSEKALSLAQSLDFSKDSALTYVINTGLLVNQAWGKVIVNCRASLKNVRNKDLFILPGLYFQLGVALLKTNDTTGLALINQAFLHAQFNRQAYYLTGFNELLDYFEIQLPKDFCEKNKGWESE